jgi:hypothetical protein
MWAVRGFADALAHAGTLRGSEVDTLWAQHGPQVAGLRYRCEGYVA